MSAGIPSRRVFVGIAVPDGAARSIARVQKRMAHGAVVSWAPPESLFIMLDVLGHIADTRLPQIIERCCAAAARIEAFDVTLDQWHVAPSPQKPQMVWLSGTVPSAQLAALRTNIARVLAPQHPPYAPLRPHVALGRIHRAAYHAAGAQPADFARTTRMIVHVDAIVLYERVRERGAQVSVPLAHIPLRAAK